MIVNYFAEFEDQFCNLSTWLTMIGVLLYVKIQFSDFVVTLIINLFFSIQKNMNYHCCISLTHWKSFRYSMPKCVLTLEWNLQFIENYDHSCLWILSNYSNKLELLNIFKDEGVFSISFAYWIRRPFSQGGKS